MKPLQLYLPVEKTKFLTQDLVFSSVHAKCEFCSKLIGVKKPMTAYQDYHAGHLIYKHNIGHESQPKEQVF